MDIKAGVKAIFRDVDETAEWYKKRLAICLDCPFNTINGSKNEKGSAIIKTLEIAKPLLNQENESTGNCTVCTCYINKKCSDKGNACPILKWDSLIKVQNNLEVEAVEGIENLEQEQGFISVHLGNVQKNTLKKGKIIVKTGKFNLVSTKFSCSCMMLDGEIKTVKKNIYEIPFILSTSNKPRNVEQKTIMILETTKELISVPFKYNVY